MTRSNSYDMNTFLKEKRMSEKLAYSFHFDSTKNRKTPAIIAKVSSVLTLFKAEIIFPIVAFQQQFHCIMFHTQKHHNIWCF